MEESEQMLRETEKEALLPGTVLLQTEAEVVETKRMKVMVAADESEVSLYALKWAVDNLFMIKGSSPAAADDEMATGQEHRVIIVHVMQPFQSYVFPAGPSVYATTSVVESVRKAQQQNAASVVSRALEICKQKGIKAETLIFEGDPKDMICQIAEEMNIDLLVVGSRGLSRIKRAFLGSVSDYCAHHAKCPIIIVKPPKEEHENKS